MRVLVRYRRDGMFVEPVREELAALAFRYIRHLAEAQFGQDSVTRASPEPDHEPRADRGKRAAKQSPT